MFLKFSVFFCLLPGLLLLSFPGLLLLSFSVVRAKTQTFTRSLEMQERFCLKKSFADQKSCFPSNLKLLLSGYIKFWMFVLFAEFLNDLAITCFGESTCLSFPSYLGKNRFCT